MEFVENTERHFLKKSDFITNMKTNEAQSDYRQLNKTNSKIIKETKIYLLLQDSYLLFSYGE